MILYLDRAEVPDLEEISPEVIRYCVRKAEQANGRYQRLDRYYRGEHDIFRRAAGEEELRVAANYAKYVVDIALGYYLGEGVKYDANPRHNAGLRGGREIDLSPLLSCYDRQHIRRADLVWSSATPPAGRTRSRAAPVSTRATASSCATRRWSTTSSLP